MRSVRRPRPGPFCIQAHPASADCSRSPMHRVPATRGAGESAAQRVRAPQADSVLTGSPTMIRDRLVVLCSNKHADHHLSASFFAHVAVDARLATQHQYILLSSNPATIPPALATHLTQLGAPVIPKPFDRMSPPHATPLYRQW